MSVSDTAVPARQNTVPVVRERTRARRSPGRARTGAARAVMAAGERLAREAGAPVVAFHTVSFMTGAIAMYERLGYRRAPEFDYDWAARHSPSAATSIMAITFLRDLTGTRADSDGARPAGHVTVSRCA